MIPRRGRTRLVLSVCLPALALAGCGGGGSGGGGGVTPITPVLPPPSPPPPPPPPPPPASGFNDAEYQRSSGTNFENAIVAYDDGATGRGIKIGLVDTGVNPKVADLAGKVDPASGDVAGGGRGITDQSGHGTATAATAAGARNGTGMMGVAFDATIVSENSSDPVGCTADKCDSSDAAIARGIDAARAAGVRVINISLGSDDASPVVNAAIARAAAAGIVVVMSAGNDGASATGGNPEGFAAAAAAENSNVIIAGAVDQSRTIASFSNRAGTSAASYLTALGDHVVAPDNKGQLDFWAGTSFSAPIISGAVALLAQAFPNLTGRQIIAILYQSADDAGAPGVDSVYGNGILDIGRAFQPIGTLSLPGSKAVFNPLPAGGTSSGPMGDASPRVRGGVIVLDGFSRAYVVSLVQTLRQAPQERPLAEGLQPGLSTSMVGDGPTALSITVRRDLVGPSEIGFAPLGLTAEDAHRAKLLSGLAVTRLSHGTAIAFGISESGHSLQQRLVDAGDHAFLVARDPMTRMGFHADASSSVGVRQSVGRLGITLTGERGHVYEPLADPRLAQPLYNEDSLILDRRFGRALVTLGTTRLAEQQTVLGARLTGPAGAGGATSWFADMSGRYDLGRGWALGVNYRRGWTRMAGLGALAENGRLSTDAWSFDVARDDAFRPGDGIAIRLMQPLRVRSGGLSLNVPVAYDYSTLSATYESQLFNLAPTGREIDLEAVYGLPFLGGRLTANAFARRQPGNIAALAPDLGGALRFSTSF